MARAEQFLQRMIDNWRLRDPDMDIAPGTPEYHFLEVAAIEMESVTYDGTLMDYHFDITTKSGVELDQFVALWGMVRTPANRASGLVTFTRGTPADQDYSIPSGTQVFAPLTPTSPTVFFTTVSTASLLQGETSLTVPIQAAEGGAIGNLAAGRISGMSQQLGAASQVINQEATTGGTDAETDAELRQRWSQTTQRALTGTEDMFRALCFEHTEVTHTLVVGPLSRYEEQVAIASGLATSQITAAESKYTYAQGGEHVGTDLDQPDEVLARRLLDYNISTAIPPVVTFTSPVGIGLFPNGTVVGLDHEYTPVCSRNDPNGGITNKVDIFINGENLSQVTEELPFLTTATWTFDNAGGAMDRDNWLREDGVTTPVIGSYFTQLFKAPLRSVPTSISAGATTYLKDVHYFVVHDVTVDRGSIRARDGIEWLAGSGSGDTTVHPASSTEFTVTYNYNQLVEIVHESIALVSLITTDTEVHQPRYLRLRFNLGVVLIPGFSIGSVTSDISGAVSSWLTNKNFQDNVQLSDLIEVVGSVAGVDNVRLIKSTEALDEVDRISVVGTGGSFKLSVPDGQGGIQTTAIIAYNATNSVVLAALNALPAIGGAGVAVAARTGSGTAVDPYLWVLTWSGTNWGQRNVGITIDDALITGTGHAGTLTETTTGIGYGIESIADNGRRHLANYTTDIYLNSDQLPALDGAIGVAVKILARNTF